jgi:hypothetical protein
MEGRGADISFTAHRHEKAYLQKVVKEMGGGEKTIHCISLGCYKKSDRHSRKMGWPRRDDASMGAFGIILFPGEKRIDVYWTLEEAVDTLIKF